MRYLQQKQEINKVNLDLKDRKIFSILSTNSRIPLTKLAKKVGLSRDAVKYRIKNYEKKGIIQGYRAMVDIKKFGYTPYHLFIKLNNPSQEIEKKIINKLIKNPFIRALIRFSGNYDFEIALIAKDIYELDRVIEKIIKDCFDLIQDYEILIMPKTYVAETFPPSFSGYKLIHDFRNLEKKKDNYKIDKKDIKILKLMSENAKIPLYEIADKLKLSADAVNYRIKNMVRAGVILKFIPVINYSALSFNLYTILLNINTLDERKEKLLKKFLITNQNTLWAVKTIGRFNVLIYLLVRDVDNLQDTMIKLRRLFPKKINRYETLIAYEEYKYIYFPKKLF